jgi:hypothetical protein
MYFILYISSLDKIYTGSELNDMCSIFRKNNEKNNITGFMTCKIRDVMQLIEGERHDVIELYKKISTDSRHKRMTKLLSGHSEKRFFPDWKMSFQFINTEDGKFDNTYFSDFLQIENYIDLKTDRRISLLFNSFKNNKIIKFDDNT